MSLPVEKNKYIIRNEIRSKISDRYKRITKSINREIWECQSETEHSFYVGSYGRGTAINTSDIDILIEVPERFHVENTYTSYNPQSRLLQIIKGAILDTYSTSKIHADGQVVVIDFSDDIKFEILPAIKNNNKFYDGDYIYPDTHMGGNWLSTNPKAEIAAIKCKDDKTKGLLISTCKHIRYIRDNYFSSYHLSGIIIDTFCYYAVDDWSFSDSIVSSYSLLSTTYEQHLLDYFYSTSVLLNAPGSGDFLELSRDRAILEKILKKMAH